MAEKRIMVVAGLLETKGGQLLIAKRPPGTARAGQWEFPGGKVEAGETLAEALKRELKEELELNIEPTNKPRLIGAVKHDYDDIKIKLFGLAISFDATQTLGSQLEWRLVAPHELNQEILTPPDRVLLTIYKQKT